MAIECFFDTKPEGSRGRPRKPARDVLNGILWVCKTGARWEDVPDKYPSHQTCHRYFQAWNKSGVWDQILWVLADHLKHEGKIDITECFIDGSFTSAKKGAVVLAKLREVKARRSWQSETLMAFLSPYGPPAQASMK